MKFITVFVLFLSFHLSIGQSFEIETFRDSLHEVAKKMQSELIFEVYNDSLYQVLKSSTDDSSRVWAMVELSNNYKYRRPDSAVYFARKAIDEARKHNLPEAELSALAYYIITESAIGNNLKAIQLALHKIKLAEENNLQYQRAIGVALLGWAHFNLGNYENAKRYYHESLEQYVKTNNHSLYSVTSAYLAELYSIMGQRDSAIYYSLKAESYPDRNIWTEPFIALHIGRVYRNIGDYNKSVEYLMHSRKEGGGVEAFYVFLASIELAELYHSSNEPDSALYFGYEALSIAEKLGFYSCIVQANQFLADYYTPVDISVALAFSEASSSYKDSLSLMERSMAIEEFENIDQAERQRELEEARKDFQSRLRTNALLGSSFTLLVVAVVLYRSRRLKQKSKEKVEEAYNQLKATQSQLIQSEKMASLGELTAGIAHEIQNPLNFVNNFSDVNKELAQELMEEIEKGNEQEAKAIIKDIIENEEKILHHGKRADGIVKGMLQHSRGSSGEKEPADINELADEYLRLAYHGLRAKDKSFNADFKTELDPNLPKVNVVPQDMGRVLLNLINNAFYAVSTKTTPDHPELVEGSEGVGSESHASRPDDPVGRASASALTDKDYKPTVTVSTKNLGDKIEIRVIDNGDGIPEQVRDKIFQPFFTTKASGEGTGLGLSLSYDIVTKGHGGTIDVKSKTGKGTEFIIRIPC